MDTAKVFTSGRSQAVRIPMAYRFDVDEVFINKVGDAVILTPKEHIRELFDQGLAGFTEDFMADGRPPEIQTERADFL